MLYYFIQIFVLQFIFLLFYELFLKNETFFQWNRLYLLITLVLSILFPFIKIGVVSENTVWHENLQPVIIGNVKLQESLISEVELPYYHSILLLYLAGLFVSLMFFVYKIYTLYTLTRKNTVVKDGKYKLVLLPDNKEAFTFLNFIFVDKNTFQNDSIQIIEHEKIHIQQKHWLDLLWIEILKIVFWWNPFIYIYQKKIAVIHEYIADRKLLKNNDLQSYFNQVLQQTFKVRNISFVNQFYKPSIIKKRIVMQKRKNSKQIKKLKFVVFAIILMGVGLVLDACQNQETVRKETEKTQKVIIKEVDNQQDNDDVEVAFKFIKNPPVYPGCEGKEADELKDCMSKKIQKFILDNFNTDIAKKLELEGEKVKIITQFAIDTNGKVDDIKARAKYPELAEEAKRVIALLPEMQPGKQDNNPVQVRYTLPIIFKVDK